MDILIWIMLSFASWYQVKIRGCHWTITILIQPFFARSRESLKHLCFSVGMTTWIVSAHPAFFQIIFQAHRLANFLARQLQKPGPTSLPQADKKFFGTPRLIIYKHCWDWRKKSPSYRLGWYSILVLFLWAEVFQQQPLFFPWARVLWPKICPKFHLRLLHQTILLVREFGLAFLTL